MELNHFFVDGSAIQVRKQLTNAEIHLAATNTRVDADDLFKLPLDQVVALGAGHDPLPTMSRSATTVFNVTMLFRSVDKVANLLDASRPNKSADGLIGSYNAPGAGFRQARFCVVDPGSVQSVATMPCDPTMLFTVLVSAQINQKIRCHPGYRQRGVCVHEPGRQGRFTGQRKGTRRRAWGPSLQLE